MGIKNYFGGKFEKVVSNYNPILKKWQIPEHGGWENWKILYEAAEFKTPFFSYIGVLRLQVEVAE